MKFFIEDLFVVSYKFYVILFFNMLVVYKSIMNINKFVIILFNKVIFFYNIIFICFLLFKVKLD